MDLGRNKGKSVTCNASVGALPVAVAGVPFADRFDLRHKHRSVRVADALAFLAMDTARRRHFVDLRLGPRTAAGWEWVYVRPLSPAIWYAERPDDPYPLARMLVLFPGFCPAQTEVRGRKVELADGEVVMAGHPKASRLLRRPRLAAPDGGE